jgi:hypothetical protein
VRHAGSAKELQLSALMLMGTRERHLTEERKLRARADECRRLARMTADEKMRSAYIELADRYDALAEEERDLSFIYKE